MDNVTHEYDHFGPWLLQVKSEQDIPHQYFEYQDIILAAKYCFKIPIKEERRKLHAGMLLYNKVIVIEDKRILALSIINDQVSEQAISFKDVQYILHQGDLLNCEICLVTNSERLDFQYNLVSMELAGTAMHLLRDGVNRLTNTPKLPDNRSQAFSDSQIFTYFCITENESQSIEILNYQPCLALGLLASNKLFQPVNKYSLLDSMFMTNGVELIIANRGKYIVQESDTNYKFGHTFIPLKLITNVAQENDEMFSTIKGINIAVGQQQVQAQVHKDFVINALESLLVRKTIATV